MENKCRVSDNGSDLFYFLVIVLLGLIQVSWHTHKCGVMHCMAQLQCNNMDLGSTECMQKLTII